MPIDRVREFLAGFPGERRIMEFAESSATVELAAEQVGTEPARIAKTLAFYDPTAEDQTVLIVAAGDAKLHNGSFKRRFGGKAKMVQRADVVARTGYEVGGVCPFANPVGTRVYLDESLKRFTTVFPAAGTAASAVELTPSELETFSNAVGWVDVCKDWRPGEG